MKNTTKTAAKAAKMPTPEALEAAKAKAVQQMRKEAEEPKAKAEAKAARAKADKATAKAEALATEWRAIRAEADKATAEALEALTDEARALYTATKKARAKAREMDEEAEALEAKAEALAADLDHVLHGQTLCLVWTFRTPEEAEAAEAKAEAREALRDLAAATAEAKAEAKSNPAKAKAARARAAALAKLPAVMAARAAEAKASEARKNAPKVSTFIGAAVNESRPTLALAFAHSVAARIAEALKITDKVTKTAAVWNVADPETLLPAARAVAKKTAENATMRQGTPTQWRIYREALAGEWDAPDIADMATEAAAALAIFTAPADLVRRETEAAALLEKTAETLDSIGTFDGIASAAVVQAAEEESRAYMQRKHRDPKTGGFYTASDPRLCDNPDKMKTRAAALRVALEARAAAKAGNEAEALDLATRAAYRAVNNYLAEARAIRAEARAEALNLETLAETIADPRHLDPEAVSEYEAKHRAIIRAAYAEAVEALTPAQKKALSALYKAGGSNCEAARIADRNESTIREHRRALADIFAAALVKTAPESIEQKALNLVSIVGGLEAAEAAAAIAAAKARREAEEAADKAAEALDKAKTNEATAAAIAAAVAEAVEALPPVMKQTARLLASGTAKAEAARILCKSRATVREAAKTAAAKIAEAIAAAAPAVDIPADIIARADLAALFALAKSIVA